jgi:hypothetical protein
MERTGQTLEDSRPLEDGRPLDAVLRQSWSVSDGADGEGSGGSEHVETALVARRDGR